jgi:hypothetical protein
MGAQLWQETRIAPQVGTPKALVTERAGLPVRLDVGRLGADAERHGDLTDGVTGRVGLEKSLDHRATALAITVHLERGQQVDGLSLSLVGDGEVHLGGAESAMSHELGQHLDRRARIGVTLRKTVPE